MQLVERAKQYIVHGEAFQVVLSRLFKKPYTVSPFAIYRSLRSVSPAPYMFYLPIDNSVILGASPERLVSVQGKQVGINPIAGTRRRTAESDLDAITQDLLSDKKECAEHTMLVDLARNDLGSTCLPGSVKVSELMRVRHFSHVSHIASTVVGQLKTEKDALDVLAAVFPAGTLSGAPKIRAMEIIDELEVSRRGLYGGVICRIDNQGDLDSCIAIRMAVLQDGIATVRTGAGIVYDSNPQAEADETRQKAQGVLEAIRLAERQ
jgi:anthranilate synthase component 1